PDMVRQCQAGGSVFELTRYWPKVYQQLGLADQAQRISAEGLKAQPIETNEVEFLATHYRVARWQHAVQICWKWLESSGTDHRIEAKLLDLHSPKEVEAALRTSVATTGDADTRRTQAQRIIRDYVQKRAAHVFGAPDTPPALFGKFLYLTGRV